MDMRALLKAFLTYVITKIFNKERYLVIILFLNRQRGVKKSTLIIQECQSTSEIFIRILFPNVPLNSVYQSDNIFADNIFARKTAVLLCRSISVYTLELWRSKIKLSISKWTILVWQFYLLVDVSLLH